MTFDVATMDCTALTEADLVEMSEMCSEIPDGYALETLEKVREEWVLISRIRSTEDGVLHGFSMSTLERIGGTPCILLGLGFIRRSEQREPVLDALMAGNYHRALMAFPDEDVLVGTRMATAGARHAYAVLADIVPRPDHEANGEERQWGRRLSKRFGIDADHYEARIFTVRGDGSPALFFDYEAHEDKAIDADVASLYDEIDAPGGDSLITFGWMMAEELLNYQNV